MQKSKSSVKLIEKRVKNPNTMQLFEPPLIEKIFRKDKKWLVDKLWEISPEIHRILKHNDSVDMARYELNHHLSFIHLNNRNATKRKWAKGCIHILQNIIHVQNEKDAGFSPLRQLFHFAHEKQWALDSIKPAFLHEFLYLLKAIKVGMETNGDAKDIYSLPIEEQIRLRSAHLDSYDVLMKKYFDTLNSGLDADAIKNAAKNKEKILKKLDSTNADWDDYRWQLKHRITTKRPDLLLELVSLTDEERSGIDAAIKYGVSFSISPYHLSLLDFSGISELDTPLRAQVIPTEYRCSMENKARNSGIDMDFMGERSTSPAPNITRRYVNIVILKPVLECFQYCDYCQRNWEYSESDSIRDIQKSLDWLKENKHINEVLITGGDPLVLPTKRLTQILDSLSYIEHIKRIRIGTRAFVTSPMRFNDTSLLDLFSDTHSWGRQELSLITHLQHSLEMTPDTQRSLHKIKSLGINIYNQQVFTYFNSFRFQSAYNRQLFKLNGVDPYYTFNTKGKETQLNHRVPIARLMQEQWEESRLLPGIQRTDEAVFNVPKMGKVHLRSGNYDLISIQRDGSRTYKFYPWDYKDEFYGTYIYDDVPISDYLQRIKKDGQDLMQYRSIWYY